MKIILGLTGQMGAGKTTIAEWLIKEKGAQSVRFSGMLRDVADRLYIEQTRENLQLLSTTLRKTFDEELFARVMKHQVEEMDAPIVIVDGVRRPGDVSHLKDLENFYLIGVTADEAVRFERISARSENSDDQGKTREQFRQEQQQESEQEIVGLVETADHAISNNGTREELIRQVEALLDKIA